MNNSNYINQFYNEAVSPSVFQALMRKVYVWMTLALVITGFTAYGVATSPGIMQAVYSSSAVLIGLVISDVALVLFLCARLERLSLFTATMMFIVYSVLNGVMFSSVFAVYTAASVANVFFISAGTFGAMSLVGAVVKKDLSALGRVLIMALIGVIIASVVNFFFKSTGLDLILNYLGVLIFTGLTAYDTQKVRNMLSNASDAGEHSQKYALMGALTLYLDFINLFIYLLRILGRRE